MEKVVGFLLKPGLSWAENKIDSLVLDPESGESWHRHSKALFEPSILCFHVSYCDPVIARVKRTYYKTVFDEISPEQAYREVSGDLNPQVGELESEGYTEKQLLTELKNVLPRELLKVARDMEMRKVASENTSAASLPSSSPSSPNS